MQHTIVKIGFFSEYKCYLNISPEEALKKYNAFYDNPPDEPQDVEVLDIQDGQQFNVYDIEIE